MPFRFPKFRNRISSVHSFCSFVLKLSCVIMTLEMSTCTRGLSPSCTATDCDSSSSSAGVAILAGGGGDPGRREPPEWLQAPNNNMPSLAPWPFAAHILIK